MSSRFIKNTEDFVCEKCGKEVKGNGYTNHCPHCLYSKHVDINPGDRKASCKGLMEPVKIENQKGDWVLTHKCQSCKYEKRNKVSREDNENLFPIIAGKDVL